jgi:hypothetical protein
VSAALREPAVPPELADDGPSTSASVALIGATAQRAVIGAAADTFLAGLTAAADGAAGAAAADQIEAVTGATATLVLWVALLSIRFWQVRLPSHSIKQLLVFELQLVFPGQLFAPVQ